MPMTLDDLRRYAAARSLFTPTTLPRAIARLGFVQADPIRAPARAQDLTLRHRVKNYRVGDLEQRYHRLDIEEDFFVNYGFLPRSTHASMHPRKPQKTWSAARTRQARSLLGFVRERGVVHPREVDAQFALGRVKNWFGGSSRACTELLDDMHYRGMLRIAGRESGVRTYAAREMQEPSSDPANTMDQLVDVVVRKYAPLPERSLGGLIAQLRSGAPQWADHRPAAFSRAKKRLAQTRIDGINWYWPQGENPASARHAAADRVRLLAPFDPVVWDRRRFEIFWAWPYRFEAYTPAPKRKLGYYALPLLWRERVIGWGNLSVAAGRLVPELGYVSGHAPREAAFRLALEAELDQIRQFLRLAA